METQYNFPGCVTLDVDEAYVMVNFIKTSLSQLYCFNSYSNHQGCSLRGLCLSGKMMYHEHRSMKGRKPQQSSNELFGVLVQSTPFLNASLLKQTEVTSEASDQPFKDCTNVPTKEIAGSLKVIHFFPCLKHTFKYPNCMLCLMTYSYFYFTS